MRVQCEACPWKKSTVPEQDIPGGYCETKHRALTSTISDGKLPFGDTLRIMACHESPIGAEIPCVGWLAHQLGEGNNIGLRLLVSRGRLDADVETVGEQHTCLEDTLPKAKRPYKKPEVQSEKIITPKLFTTTAPPPPGEEPPR